MKKTFILLTIAAAVVACGGSDKKANNSDDTSPAVAEGAAPEYTKKPEYIAGKKIIADQGLICGTCHAADAAGTGPAYEVIAKKYATADDKIVKMLANKIIKGGGGVYGAALMTPHPGLSQADAEALAKFALAHK